MNIWRINLKSAGINPRKFCLEKGIVGFGWPVNDQNTNLEWKEYYKLADEKYNSGAKKHKGWKPAINALKNRMKIGDLIWTRDIQGIYYIGKITSEWRYEHSEEFKKADMVNLRSCEWLKVGPVGSVPGKVVNSFIPRRTVQKIKNEQVKLYSKFLFNKLSSVDFYKLNSITKSDIYSLISSDDCEDILAIYLQKELNYVLFPSSCKADTMNYEYELKHKLTGEKAVVQVKNGKVSLDAKDYSNIDTKVFLFTTKGKYIGEESEKIQFICPIKMTEFIFNNLNIMPDRINYWTDLMNTIKPE